MNIADIQLMKDEKRRIVEVTAYYYEMARILAKAGPDLMLVGDSGGRFLLGHESNNDVTLDEMILMARSVRRGAPQTFVIADMPFMSYQVSVEEGVRNAGRLMKETRADAVKLEGGAEFAPVVQRLVEVGIPVQAHMGLTPMASGMTGGARDGLSVAEDKLMQDALALQDAGAFSVILTGVTPEVATSITKALRIPTISGTGAGDNCDGDIAVVPGVLGWNANELERPRAKYGPVARTILDSATAYVDDVRSGRPVRAGR